MELINLSDIMVSIFCITYNHEKYIKKAIESFLMQKTNFKFEILIHDDASTDNTTNIIKEYQKLYPDIIKPFIQQTNQYSQGVRRLNIKYNVPRAKGRYVAFCEGDDYWIDENKLQYQIDYLDKHDDCGMCFHAAEKVYENGELMKDIRPFKQDKIASTSEVILGKGGFMATNTIVCRTKLLQYEKLPDYYHIAPVGDYPLQIYLSTQKYCYYINKKMSAYRTGVKGSWTSRMNGGENPEIKMINHKLETNKMLRKLNEETDKKYNLTIEKMHLRNEFDVLIYKRKFKELKSVKYKDIYNEYDMLGKIKIFSRCFFPNVYNRLVKLKNSKNILQK